MPFNSTIILKKTIMIMLNADDGLVQVFNPANVICVLKGESNI